MHSGDLRIYKTLNAVKEAFIAQVVEKGFDQISVQEVCRTAGINRATFYRHYRDKYDLADQITGTLFKDARLPEADGFAQSLTGGLTPLFHHIAHHADLYRAMLGHRGIPAFRDRLQHEIELEMNRSFNADTKGKTTVPPELAIRYMAAAQMGLILWWLENKMSIPPVTIAAHLDTLHHIGGLHVLTGNRD